MKSIKLYSLIILALLIISCEPNNPDTPKDENPKVETGNVYDITATTATIIGSINIDMSEFQDVAFGIMYSDNKEELSVRKGNRNEAPYLNGKEFEVEIKGLKPQTMYYYCAWLFLNGKQYEYGDIKQFETLEGNIYAIGEFSISNSKKVAFSSGNLQYQASTKTWRFAENQWDYIGGANSNISSSYSGWIDLFGWGTGDNPTLTKSNSSFVDWGKNNINNEAPNTWRTLTRAEWEYVLGGRPNSHSLYGTATVNNVHGLIILPDDWNEPNLSFTSGIKGWENNVYSTAEWKELEYEGAVFLPAAGGRSYSTMYDVQDHGYYWSSYDEDYLYFSSNLAGMNYGNYRNGRSVRLVKDL